ncbi:uncharacterized protein LOC128721821 [Anopheles nili]|uniref:uncharacterized protein LOC128721821 n=1 Tax=Anopheles nili TaxID=185578 RepID=UPI00237C0887|nr:uncharacterized protein LOC128721821 [Anopheles nili]
MKKLECLGQPYKYTTVLRCDLENPRHGPQTVHVVVDLKQPIPKVYINTNIYVKHFQSRTILYGTTFEYCDFLMRNESRQNNPVAVLIYNYGKHNFPQVIRPCPALGVYNVSNLVLSENMIPPFVTPGTYYAIQWFYNKRNETLLHYESEFTVAAPSIFNRTMSLFTLK